MKSSFPKPKNRLVWALAGGLALSLVTFLPARYAPGMNSLTIQATYSGLAFLPGAYLFDCIARTSNDFYKQFRNTEEAYHEMKREQKRGD